MYLSQIPAADFCEVLEAHGLKMNPSNLDEFLARCGVVQTRDGVPYLVSHLDSNSAITHK